VEPYTSNALVAASTRERIEHRLVGVGYLYVAIGQPEVHQTANMRILDLGIVSASVKQAKLGTHASHVEQDCRHEGAATTKHCYP
jgi:hypothetical protein